MARFHCMRSSVLVGIALAAACSSGTEPGSGSLDPNALISEMSSSATQSAAASMSGTAMPSLPTPTAAGCVYTASSQSFVCQTVSLNGMTMSMSYMLYDAAGHAVSIPDPVTVDAIRTIMDMSGTTTPMGTMMSGPITMTRHQDQTMSGLLSGNRVINGTASGTTSSVLTVNGSSITTSTTDADTTLNMVPPAPGSSTHYPQSGTQIMVMTSSSPAIPTGPVTMRMVMTIHPDGTMTAQMTTGGVVRTCTMNLASPTTPPSCS